MTSNLSGVLNFDSINDVLLSNLTQSKKKQILSDFKQKEIFNHMITKQNQNRWYNGNILFKKERIKVIFGVIQKTSEILELNLNTFCLAIHLFDALAAKFPLEKNEMLPIGLVCMQMASKIKENQGNIVNYKDLNEYVYNYGVEYFLRIEKTIMEHLDFKINLISPNVILNFLLRKFLKKKFNFFEDLENSSEITSKFFKIIMNVHLITLVDYEFYKFSSLAVATSILAFSRILLGLEALPNYISEFIGISQSSIQQCLQMIYENYSINFVQTVLKQIDDEVISDNEIINENNEEVQLNSLIQNSTLFFLNKKFQDDIITTVNSKQEIY